MACGCFPVAGDIESVREWITDGVNGLLCDATDPDSLADAISRALGHLQLREKSRAYNNHLVMERAEYSSVIRRAEEFYSEIICQSKPE